MIVDFKPSIVEARIYENGGYKERSAYAGSFIIHLMGDEAWIALLTNVDENQCKAWSKEIYVQAEEYLKRQGIKWVNFECKGKKVRRDISAGHEQTHG